MKCEICGQLVHHEAYHKQIENLLSLISRGYMPAMLSWTHLKNADTDGIVAVRYSDNRKLYARSVIASSYSNFEETGATIARSERLCWIVFSRRLTERSLGVSLTKASNL